MRSRILAVGILAVACSAAIHAQAGSKAATEKALIANENRVNDAIAKHDIKLFYSLVDEKAVSADQGGFMAVADFIKSIDQVKMTTWHIMNPQVIWVDDKTAVVAYTWMGKGTYMDKPFPGTAYASTVWTERNGHWVAVFHQESAAGPPPPPPPAKKK